MTIDTLLFDLDGTLVQQFGPGSSLQFTWLVVRRFAGLAPAPTIVRAGHAAVAALRANACDRPNHDVMVDAFVREAGCPRAEVEARLARLAEDDFRAMGWRFRPVPGARRAVERARTLGFRLVLATNPTVPLAMTRHRLAWAGLADVDWALLTHPGIMSRTKPHLGYYRELLAQLGCGPERCLMIGDDPDKDLPAMDLGIRTFLLDGRRARRRGREPDHLGGFADLERLLVTLSSKRDELDRAS